MRQLSTPCLFSDHDHCMGHVHDLYGDEQHCACPCHYRKPLPGYLPAGLDGAQHARRLAIALAIAALAYLALCVISASVAHAAASLLSR